MEAGIGARATVFEESREKAWMSLSRPGEMVGIEGRR